LAKIKNRWTLIFWSWIALWIVAFILAAIAYGSGAVFGFSLLAFPLFIFVFFIPLFVFADKSKISIQLNFPSNFPKAKYQTLLMGLMLIPGGLIYYFEEWDYKYRVHIPSSTGLLLIGVGIILIVYSLIPWDNS
jgi:hypothetical protein